MVLQWLKTKKENSSIPSQILFWILIMFYFVFGYALMAVVFGGIFVFFAFIFLQLVVMNVESPGPIPIALDIIAIILLVLVARNRKVRAGLKSFWEQIKRNM